MKRVQTFPLLAILFLLALPLGAQPIIYMIPDVGTPGMNSYVEVIAPVGQLGKFVLADGLVSPAFLSITFTNPADSLRIRVSPGVISWDRRMISFQFFVSPNSPLGDVPMQLRANTSTFDIGSFHIVAPQPFGVKDGGGVIGSGGGWGDRSGRGAMIVDSMILNNGTYTIDTRDPDATVNGNQGYLPLIILSKGRIVIGPGATIVASAPGGVLSKNGGPGGGGGGGYGGRGAFFPLPAVPAERDVPLGSGFAGGSSAVPLFPAIAGNFGEGTGANSASLNDVKASAIFSPQRLYAGAPGHPFDDNGQSGGAGEIGLGVGLAFGQHFGGGGNATKGSGLPPGTPDAVNGQIIGNRQLVPLHGGAGGASGGPNDSVGGGGGGALALYSATGALISSAEARGGDGKNGFNGALSGDPSGGGAGGGITIGGKRGVQIGTINVSGGIHGTAAPSAVGAPVAGDGGIGRFRHDGRSAGGFSLTTGASSFTGPTTDTLTYADSMQWTIRGTGRYLPGTGGDSIYIFVRGENSGWNFATPFRAIVGADSTWSARIALPYDSLAYICAVQLTPAADIAASTQATRAPSHIFSQSAANIVRLHLIPVIVAPVAHRMDTVTCPVVLADTIPVRNSGTGLLIIGTGSGFVGPNGQFYKIVSPALPDTIRPDSTGSIVISFDGINAPAGTIGATLRLVTNDPATPQKDIAIDIVKEPRLRALREKIIDMGDVYVGTSRDTVAVYRNLNSYRDTLNAIVPFFSIGPGTMVRTAPSLISIQKGLDSAIIGFTYTPVDTGRFEIRYRIYSDPCDQQDTLIIRGYARSPIISARKTWELTGLACGDTATGQFFVRNNGNAPLVIQNPTITGPGAGNYTVITPAASSFPLQVRGGDSGGITVRVIYAGAGGVPAAQLSFANNDGFRGKNPYTIDLFADKDPAGLSVTDSVLDFGVVCIGKDGFRTIGLHNDAQRATRTIISVTHSDPASPFFVVIPAEFPGDISPATTSDLSIRLDAVRPGTFLDTISLLYQPCNRHIRLILRGEVVRAGLVLTPASVEFGEVQIGKASRKTVIITNPNTPGGAPVTISRIAIVPASSSVTIIQPAIPPARTLAPGDTLRVMIEYTPGTSGKLPKTAMAIVVDAPCADSSRYAITGSGTNANIGVSRTEIAFKIAACTQPNWVDDSLVVFNAGTSPIDITNITTAGDGIFTLLSPIPPKFTLPPGGTRPVHVRYSAFDAGESSGTLDFTTTDPNRETFEVDLRGVLDSVNIVPATKHLILPQIFSCRKSSKGKLWLRNIGTALATLDAVYITSPYSFAPPAKTPIPPGDSIAVDLTFAPVADGVYSAWLIYEISPCNIRDSVLVTAERASARYDITNVDFGLVSVGGSTAGSATLTNRNSVGIWVTDAQIAPPNGTITIDPGQIPQFIAAGTSTQIGLRFTPAAIGDIPTGTKLVITADSTCPSTLEAGITGTGTAGGIDVSPLSLQFGALLRCQDARDTLFIRNIGTAPLMVQHMDISAQDPTAAFAILDGPTPSTLIPAGGSDTIIIRFVPGNGPDASITGLLTLYTNDPINPPVKISLFGSRISQRLALAGPLFAQVEAGKTGSSTRWIINTGSAPVTINALSIGAPFAVSGSRPGLPVTLAPGDSLETDITFSPLTPEDYADSIAIGSPLFCDSIFLAVDATGFDLGIIQGIAMWGRVSGAPGETVNIPLLLNNDLTEAAVTGYTASARFNPSMLIPRRIVLENTLSSGWNVASQTFSPGSISFSATGAVPLKGTGILAYLEAEVMLGDSVTTLISAGDTSGTNSKQATLSVAPGLFMLNGYCLAGGTGRLIRITDGFGLKSVSPNPFSGRSQVEFATTEDGPARLTLFDQLGREAAVLVEASLPARSYIVTLSGTDFPSGVYYLELRTPTQRDRRQVIILR